MTLSLEISLHKAMEETSFQIECKSNQQANNYRQRFYRFRDKIRGDSTHPLNLVIDSFQFHLNGKSLIVSFSDTEIWEKVNEHESRTVRKGNSNQ